MQEALFCLQPVKDEAENGAMRVNRRYTALAVAILAFSLAGLTQDRDQDRYGYSKTSATAPPPEARVDINRASVEDLLKVPGMTRSWAGRIVRFRPYRTKLDLVDKGVITAVAYDRIKDSIIAHRAPD